MYSNGLKYSEIAEVLNLNPNSVGKMISRTIEKFVKIVKKEYHELFQKV
jgi:DNA-directed RNA polymerase specialized sigma24 family protein